MTSTRQHCPKSHLPAECQRISAFVLVAPTNVLDDDQRIYMRLGEVI